MNVRSFLERFIYFRVFLSFYLGSKQSVCTCYFLLRFGTRYARHKRIFLFVSPTWLLFCCEKKLFGNYKILWMPLFSFYARQILHFSLLSLNVCSTKEWHPQVFFPLQSTSERRNFHFLCRKIKQQEVFHFLFKTKIKLKWIKGALTFSFFL